MNHERISNPILDSLLDIARSDFAHELCNDYHESMKQFKSHEEFISFLEDISVDIQELREKCKPGTSFTSAGFLLAMPNPEDPEFDAEEHKFMKQFIYAAIAHRILKTREP